MSRSLRTPPLRRFAPALAVGLGVLLVATPLLAMHRQTAFLVNLSKLPGGISTNPGPPQFEPNHVYFQSVSDLKHNGSTGSEIFFYVLRPDTVGSNTLRQITNFAGDSQNVTASETGWVAAFDSNADIVGTGNNIKQIFLFYRAANSFVQLTDGQADSTLPVIDLPADAVAFQSMADLKTNGALSGFSQIYFYSLVGGAPPCDVSGCHLDPNKLVQVTNWAGNSTNPYLAGAGGFVVFQSDVFGASQIFIFDRGNGGVVTQLTNGSGDSTNPCVDGSGNFVTFQSTADLLGNGSTGSQIFYLDRERNDLRQITLGPGGSIKPSIGNLTQSLSFVSTADLLGTGATGQHLFVFDPHSLHLFQVTKQPGKISDHPKTAGNFILFDTDEDIMGTGMTGRQVYSVDLFNHIPKIGIGKRVVPLQPNGSLLPTGSLTIVFGDRDGRSEGGVQLLSQSSSFPPIPVPNVGTFCLKPTGNGQGVYDCRGGRPGGDVLVSQDHDTSNMDFTCALAGSCREGNPCKLPLLSPHRKPCPACVNGTCSTGPNAGAPCYQNDTCLLNQTCVDGGLGVCNGPVRTEHAGKFVAGGVDVALPVSVGLSLDPGRDGIWCDTDDTWVFQNLNESLELTTGMVTGTINDANDVPNSGLVATDTGSGFDCFRLEKGNFQNAALVGQLPLLDVPGMAGVQDVLVPVHLSALAGTPYTACTTLACRIITYCTSDSDCDDASVCNGQEHCINNSCVPGTPLMCDDGNPCNGVETCDPVLGCQPGTGNPCDDGARCTADSCDSTTGTCTHVNIPGCCTSDLDCRDNNVCNGAEHCVSGNCVAGTPLVCDDGNACNGVETCDPVAGCVAGTPPNCNDGARCTIDSCDPALGCVHTSVHGCCTTDADCRDNNVCNGLEGCSNGDCVPGTPLQCNDNNVCNGTETCDPYSGCVEGTPLVCPSNGSMCFPTSCDPTNGCIRTSTPGCCHTDADCSDNNACNGTETCVNGNCVGGTPLVCDDGNVCNGVETCNPTTGCQPGTPLTCGPSPARCTTVTCDTTKGCVQNSIPGCCQTDADCQDGSACNGVERCVNGDCVAGTPLFCDDGNPCNGKETCNDATGCQPGTAPASFTFEGVQCAIDALWNEFRNTNPGSLGGKRRYAGLERLLVGVRKNFGYLSPKGDGTVSKSVIKPLGGVSLLQLFERRLTSGMKRGVVVSSSGTPLKDLADAAITALLEFNAQAPRPKP